MSNIQFDQDIYKKVSARELQAAQLAKEGFSIVEAADQMGIKPSTVSTYRCRILDKLGCRTMTEAVVSLIEAGIL